MMPARSSSRVPTRYVPGFEPGTEELRQIENICQDRAGYAASHRTGRSLAADPDIGRDQG